MLDTIALAIALGVVAFLTIPLARLTAPRGIGRERHQRLLFWLGTFPLYLATIGALALATLQGLNYLTMG